MLFGLDLVILRKVVMQEETKLLVAIAIWLLIESIRSVKYGPCYSKHIFYSEKANIETQRLSQFMESSHFHDLIQTDQQKIRGPSNKICKLMAGKAIVDIIAMGNRRVTEFFICFRTHAYFMNISYKTIA